MNVAGSSKTAIGIIAPKVTMVTSKEAAQEHLYYRTGGYLALPERHPSEGLDLQFLLQDFTHQTLLWSSFHLLSPNHIHTLWGQDQVTFDRLQEDKARS